MAWVLSPVALRWQIGYLRAQGLSFFASIATQIIPHMTAVACYRALSLQESPLSCPGSSTAKTARGPIPPKASYGENRGL